MQSLKSFANSELLNFCLVVVSATSFYFVVSQFPKTSTIKFIEKFIWRPFLAQGVMHRHCVRVVSLWHMVFFAIPPFLLAIRNNVCLQQLRELVFLRLIANVELFYL
ncbi:hypothetical protein A6A40_25110 (plasmid) [Azospirillum humicireducens]|uniref:Uncharacterized protein n=1 Tax=Azospirillum humicireducens TaxID=1226968 RepID=A0A2R4VV48_9PROT|nr:hypothetical protein A6A40_25110 [Azospirillum humicireducens]